MCRVPFLRYKQQTLIESASILRFLCLEFPNQLGLFYPNDNLKRAKIDAILDWNGTEFRPAFKQVWDAYIEAKEIGIWTDELKRKKEFGMELSGK